VRIAYLLVCLFVVAVGALFGALNALPVSVDFHFFIVELRLGVALLLSGLAGAALGGGCVWVGVVLPLRRQLRRERRGVQRQEQALALAVDETRA
jgi:uncharacterized integral membrane protein